MTVDKTEIVEIEKDLYCKNCNETEIVKTYDEEDGILRINITLMLQSY